MDDDRRLIEAAFPLEQASIDSVHEKSVRHGHISTLHIWPARRPLAACRAALIATLLPDPGSEDKRKDLIERLGGRVVERERRLDSADEGGQARPARQTQGGILHWGREASSDLDWFREQIKQAYGGRPPRVLDPFAGGGAIPLEAMRLGCEAIAGDLNPVAWLILKCTLEYPHRLAGQVRPLPSFAVESDEFMETFRRGQRPRAARSRAAASQQLSFVPATAEANLAWHIRAWGMWVLDRVKEDLGRYYPVIDGKTTIAYLWARTVKCKNCRATIPLLKTLWLSRKENRRVLLTLTPNAERQEDRTGVAFGIQYDVPVQGSTRDERAAHDRMLGQGTMSRAGAWCPCCGRAGTVAMTMEDIRQEGVAGRLGEVMTAVVVDGQRGREFRLPAPGENEFESLLQESSRADGIPFGELTEPVPQGGGGAARAFSVDGFGLRRWRDLFNHRQLAVLTSLVGHSRATKHALVQHGYPGEWIEAIRAYLGLAIDKLADYSSTLCTWHITGQKLSHTFVRFALPVTWDYCEVNPFSQSSGNYLACVEWVARSVEHLTVAAIGQPAPRVNWISALAARPEQVDLIVTDPPYYDAIPYSDLMDFFYVWLRRSLHGLSPEMDRAFSSPLSPKWDHEAEDGELIDDSSRFGGDARKSRDAYEDGMYRAFLACNSALRPNGRMVVVFAHKHPDAWQALVGAMIRAGFVVRASWPVQTELANRTRALTSAALSSSVWLVCAKRPPTARPGWDGQVLEAMRDRLYGKQDAEGNWVLEPRLHQFWDAGIRGPDFVWAATGPALEAYSQFPAVKRANEPGKRLEVGEFLASVRRMVVDFVVGRLLSANGGTGATGLDDVTTYYLLHRHAFRLDDAPAGACILYAVSCGLSDRDLSGPLDILSRSGSESRDDANSEDDGGESDDDAPGEEGPVAGGGATFRLKTWTQRRGRQLGYTSADGRAAPMIDQIHRLMRLWTGGDAGEVNAYLDSTGIRRQALFHHVLQAVIELSHRGSQERSVLESISNHLGMTSVSSDRQMGLPWSPDKR